MQKQRHETAIAHGGPRVAMVLPQMKKKLGYCMEGGPRRKRVEANVTLKGVASGFTARYWTVQPVK